MTTAFALLMHGDPRQRSEGQLGRRAAGLLWLLLIPWGVVSAIRSRFVGV